MLLSGVHQIPHAPWTGKARPRGRQKVSHVVEYALAIGLVCVCNGVE